MKRKKTEVTVERDQILVIKRLDNREPRSCSECGELARMVSVDEAASIAGSTARAIYRQVETGQIHFSETTDGLLLICLNSLLK